MTGGRWRQGGKVPHHVYAQRGEEPDPSAWPDGDRPVATFHSPEDALRAVEAVNGALTPDSARIRAERDELAEQMAAERQRHEDLEAELRRVIASLERQMERARREREASHD